LKAQSASAVLLLVNHLLIKKPSGVVSPMVHSLSSRPITLHSASTIPMAKTEAERCSLKLLKVKLLFKLHLTTGHFKFIPNGLPGLETRLPLLMSGVLQGRLTLQKFVELTSTNPAKLYGCYPQKGTLLPGLSDADLVIWYPGDKGAKTIENEMLHHDVDYTPYEGKEVDNWPRYTILRGEVIYAEGKVLGKKGQGEFLKRGKSSLSSPGNKFLSELGFD